MTEAFQSFGNTQIRNKATIGGHIIAGLATSDLYPILLCAGCTVSVISLQGSKRSIKVTKEFFENLGTGTSIRLNEILLSVSIPFTQQGKIGSMQFAETKERSTKEFTIAAGTVNLFAMFQDEHFHFIKQGSRRFGSYAIANAAMRIKLKAFYIGNDVSKVEESVIENMWVVEELGVVYGGLCSTPLMAKRTSEALVGRPWNRSSMMNACQMLQRELMAVVSQESDIFKENYKVSLAVSFLFKFFNEVLSKTHSIKVSINNETVGKPIAHVSSQMQVTGEATYADDTPQYKGKSVDYNKAMSHKGVITYIDSKDIPGEKFMTDDEPLFATDKVTCVGQVIGAVIAETKDVALKAAKAVKIEYEDLPPIITIEDAIAANSYLYQERKIERGDVSVGFNASDHIISSELYIGGQCFKKQGGVEGIGRYVRCTIWVVNLLLVERQQDRTPTSL
ncbi:hypothetical protein ACROYT_G009170 [Oculina patagonica]